MSNLKKAAIQIAVLIIIAAIASFAGCERPTLSTETIKEVVYEQLSETEQHMIIGLPEDGQVWEIEYTGVSYFPAENVELEEYIGKTVYRIEFQTTSAGLLGNVDVIADMHTGKILGYIPFE